LLIKDPVKQNSRTETEISSRRKQSRPTRPMTATKNIKSKPQQKSLKHQTTATTARPQTALTSSSSSADLSISSIPSLASIRLNPPTSHERYALDLEGMQQEKRRLQQQHSSLLKEEQQLQQQIQRSEQQLLRSEQELTDLAKTKGMINIRNQYHRYEPTNRLSSSINNNSSSLLSSSSSLVSSVLLTGLQLDNQQLQKQIKLKKQELEQWKEQHPQTLLTTKTDNGQQQQQWKERYQALLQQKAELQQELEQKQQLIQNTNEGMEENEKSFSAQLASLTEHNSSYHRQRAKIETLYKQLCHSNSLLEAKNSAIKQRLRSMALKK